SGCRAPPRRLGHGSDHRARSPDPAYAAGGTRNGRDSPATHVQTRTVSITIRPEHPDDPDEVAAIADVNAAAFEREAHGDLPAALRATVHYRPRWCVVATEARGVVVGHVM